MAGTGTTINLDKLRAIKNAIDQMQNMFGSAGDASLDEMGRHCSIDFGSFSKAGSGAQWITDRVAEVTGHVNAQVGTLKADLGDISRLLQDTIDGHQSAEDSNVSTVNAAISGSGSGSPGASAPSGAAMASS
jgi:hypothetical protein